MDLFVTIAAAWPLNQGTYPLLLPRSVKPKVARRAKRDGISVNQFVATAMAEKLAAMSTAEFRRTAANEPISRHSIG